MEMDENHDNGVQPDIVNKNMFDDLLKFDKYMLSVLPSLRLSLPSTPTNNVAATIVVTDSLLLNESTTQCYSKSEKVALGHTRSFSLDSIFFSEKDAEEGNMKHHFLKRKSVPHKLDEMGDDASSGTSS
ncbi:hypothetical protein Lal_00020907 [Lupinus albus]|uniref:Uncharacterized protein n=1 Tax=Lupinus albus TaxID=3870 RepID=A0A6A5MGS3_LUPAL|nr:hypothetical protein Lalb_Chr08g0237531 [Lupinus albus]KAF1871173.1 hypothetical protein Lal_00020907 [Lupinus albus]